MQRRVFGTVLGGLVVASILVLTGCEEMIADKPSPEPDEPAQLYKEADLAAIKSRWRGFSFGGGASAERDIRAAAVVGGVSEDIPGLSIDDARAYGACEVFSAHYQPDPNWPWKIDLVFLDCIDRAEQKPGHFHVAAICNGKVEPVIVGASSSPGVPKKASMYVIKAGDRERTVPVPEDIQQEFGGPIREAPSSVIGTIAGESREVKYWEAERDYYSGGVTLMRWAHGEDKAVHDAILSAAGSTRRVSFSIAYDPEPDNGEDTDVIVDTGIAEIRANDAAAVDEYVRRCAVLPG